MQFDQMKYYVKRYMTLAGDNVANSDDSRYWGLVPDDFIVGKACKIWKWEIPIPKKYNEIGYSKILGESG